jgi:ribosomal protein S1
LVDLAGRVADEASNLFEAVSGMNNETSVAQASQEATQSQDPVTDVSAAPETPSARMEEIAATNGNTAHAVPEQSERPSERIRIGTQRTEGAAAAAPAADLRPKPVNPVTEGEPQPKQSGKHYPPPNVRSAPTAEEEAELASLMAGASVGEVLDSAPAAAPTELPEGSKHKAKITRISGDTVFVELGQHLQGAVPLKQFDVKRSPDAAAVAPASDTALQASEGKPDAAEAEAAADVSHLPIEGDEIEVLVISYDPDEGTYELSLPSAPQDIGNWDEVETGKIVEVTITGKNKGGLECKVAGIRGFMPTGQISIYRVENIEEYVGQRLTAVITEANRARKNVILSHRAVMERERAEQKDKLLADLAPGQLRDGVVRSLRDFGAFVDLGGVDGLIHVSKLSWDRIGHPREVLTEGQPIKVKIEKIDPETGKIALTYRETASNPWDTAEAEFPIGSTVKGKVTKTMDFGAFIRLKAGVEGMIHVSELDHKRVHRVTDVLKEGQDVEAKVLSVDRSKQRIALSVKALMAAPPKPEAAPREEEPQEPEAPKPERKQFKNLKGGIGTPTGGEQFGLKW